MTVRDTIMRRGLRTACSACPRLSQHAEQVRGGDDPDDPTAFEHDQAAYRMSSHLVRRTADCGITFGEQDMSRHRVGNGPAMRASAQDTAIQVSRRDNTKEIGAVFDDEMMYAFPAHQFFRLCHQHTGAHTLNVPAHYVRYRHDTYLIAGVARHRRAARSNLDVGTEHGDIPSSAS
jgi:hypothetical protein